MLARDRLRKQIMEGQRPSAPLYHHPQFSMMKSNSIPFIPVAAGNQNTSSSPHSQSKIYDVKPMGHLYRTPSQSSKYPKFNIVNGN